MTSHFDTHLKSSIVSPAGEPVFDAAAALIQLMPAENLNILTAAGWQPPETTALHMFVMRSVYGQGTGGGEGRS